MLAAEKRQLLVGFCLAMSVAADTGNDFSSNFFTDLAPLLALFGERVTMQFMSQSTGWADNIILAMAPLGIITAIVGAIRAGGPSWLKAIIGRARKSRAVAEFELMSSTSNEVCELWNGQQIVRVMGEGPILEFVILPPEELDNRERITGKLRQGTPKTGDTASTDKSSRLIAIRNTSAATPNLTLNVHNQVGRRELYIVATLGIVLQFGVLVYCGLATRSLRLPKGESPVADYAFPCTASGTLLLVIGILLCAHVVENSTAEKRYRPRREARVIWLQGSGTVNDQAFKSFAIFPEDTQALVTTSCRTGEEHGQDEETEGAVPNTRAASAISDMGAKFRESITVAGVLVSICGFVIQFTGLRGMHWSASIAQLGAIIAMTLLRAWVRRNLAKNPKALPLVSGHELDWLAMTLGNHTDAPWLHPLEDYRRWSKYCRPWADSSCRPWDCGLPAGDEGWDWKTTAVENPENPKSRKIIKHSPDSWSKAHGLMGIRRDLGKLTDRLGPASAEAISLARAIEITMDALFDTLTGEFTWSLSVSGEPVYFRLSRERVGRWKTYSDELESALSLWLYYVNKKEWGKCKNNDEILYKANDMCSRREVDAHRVVGFAFKSPISLNIDKCQYKHRSPGSACKDASLAVESYRPLKTLYAQYMFSAFMWAAANTMEGPIEDEADVRPAPGDGTSGDSTWQSITLHNARLSKMAQEIQTTGLGSLEEIYLAIIPPLSGMNKLPRADAIIEWTRGHAKLHEQLGHWNCWIQHFGNEAAEMYLQLFQAATTALQQTNITRKATALLMECLKAVTDAIKIRKVQQFEKKDVQKLVQLKSKLYKELRSADIDISAHLLRLYQLQGRFWGLSFIENTIALGDEEIAHNNHLKVSRTKINWKDILDWTPLHYAAAKPSPEALKKLLLYRADTNVQDIRGRTPLYYACWHDDATIVLSLLREGAESNMQDTTIHGQNDAINSLIEAGVDVDVVDGLGNTALLWAALWGGSKTGLRERNGRTPLHLAAIADTDEASKRHEKDANPNAKDRFGAASGYQNIGATVDNKDKDGRTPLHRAAENGHDGKRAAIEAKDGLEWTPLHRAAVNGRETAGAVIKAKDGNERTPLDWATSTGHEAVVQLLEKNGAVQRKDGDGWTPFHWAAENGNEVMVGLLLDWGLSTEAKDEDGRTPLHRAAESGNEVIAGLLLDQGAVIEAKDRDGCTPLHRAAANGHEAVVRLLLEEGAAIEAIADNGGRTALQAASQGGHLQVVDRLLSAGANDHPSFFPLFSAALGCPSHYRIEVLHTTNSQNQTETRGGDIPSVSNSTTISDGGQTAQPQQPNDDGGASQHKTRSTRLNAGTNRITKAGEPKKDHRPIEKKYRDRLNKRFAELRVLLNVQEKGKAEVLDEAIQALKKKQMPEVEMTA
ncbi:Ankyrin repeat-containing domain protein [Rhypophila sp. PSN 637]